MRLFVLICLTLLFVSACNLTSQAPTPTALSSPLPNQEAVTLVPNVTLTPLPAIGATIVGVSTPFGNNVAPTTTQLNALQNSALPNNFPTPASGERADITSPANGASVSASPLYVSGVAHNLPQDQFTLQVFDGTGQPLTNGQTISLSNPNHVADVPWSASVMVRGYTGAAQIRVIAQSATGTAAVIGTVNVNIVAGAQASVVQPASGSYVASITSPANGTTATGNPITVTGTAGGIANNQFTLMLLDSSGTIINSQVVTLSGAEHNAVPWSATLGTSGYRGSAEIRAVVINGGQQITMASAKITLQ